MSNLMLRTAVYSYEEKLKEAIELGEIEDALDQCPVTHHFAEYLEDYDAGVYAREMFIPKGITVVGKIHKYSHLSFLLKGKLIVVSEHTDRITMEAPHTFESPAGAKRAFYAVEDSILTNVHITRKPKEDDLDAIEQEVIAKSYTELGMEEPDPRLFKEELETIAWHGVQ